MVNPASSPGYVPIRDYALIGDGHGSALVSRDGSVDWCALGRIDADPVFCRMLDAGKGGFFSIRPMAQYKSNRRYLAATNILRTSFETTDGSVAITDFMPVGRDRKAGVHKHVDLRAPLWLVRVVEGIAGRTQMRTQYQPNIAFARDPVRLVTTPFGIATEKGGPLLISNAQYSIDGDCDESLFDIQPGERRVFIVSASPPGALPAAEAADKLVAVTRAFWKEWSDYCRYKDLMGISFCAARWCSNY